MSEKLPEIQTMPFNKAILDEQSFMARYENPTEMLTCWYECRLHINETIVNTFTPNLVLQSLDNARSVWPQSEILQREITALRIRFTDPMNTPEDIAALRKEIAAYLCDLFFEYIMGEQEDFVIAFSLNDFEKLTNNCIKLLVTPIGTIFEHDYNEPSEEYEEDEDLYDEDPVEKMAKIVRATINRRLLN